MTILIASISTGKGTWAEVSKIIQIEKWSKVILIGNSFAKDNFKMNQNSEFIEIDPNKSVKEIKKLASAGQIDEAKRLVAKAYQAIDKAAKTGVIKKNKASRLKSNTARLLVKLVK